MKKFIIKLVALIALLALLQVGGHYCFFKQASPFSFIEKDRLDSWLADGIDIINFGDSVLRDVHPDDVDKRYIPDMLQSLLLDYRLASVDHFAYHPDIYADFCEYIARQKSRPQLVIVPVNMRSFSPTWDLRPRYHFIKEKQILACDRPVLEAFAKPLFVLKAFDLQPIIYPEYINTPVYYDGEQVGICRDYDNPDYKEYSDEHIKNKILYRYMLPLSAEHRKVMSLARIARVLKQNGVKVIFYATPIDHQACKEHWGDEFTRHYNENIEVVRKALQQNGAELLDLSCELAHEDFNWNLYPNEHMKEQGRMLVSTKLAERIKEFL
jgi:hypothetical protein